MRVAAAGCCLLDYLYNNCDFNSSEYKNLLSKKAGDGGLITGGLVFTEDLEKFSREELKEILLKQTSGTPSAVNLGGPAVAALANASQIMTGRDIECSFYGIRGCDESGLHMQSLVESIGTMKSHFQTSERANSSTYVLCDPSARAGKGERTFMHTVGAAWDMDIKYLPADFFSADVVLMGGTGLVPILHEQLTAVLERVKQQGGITFVGTVYDFRNEKKGDHEKWPLAQYSLIDVLLCDAEEAYRLSGEQSTEKAADFFISEGVSSLIITKGSQEVLAWSDGSVFTRQELTTFPVSRAIDEDLAKGLHEGDTTGCGDNFSGGILASWCMQKDESPDSVPDLRKALAWGAASGGFTCFYHGGTFYEKKSGEKKELLKPYADAWIKQVQL